MVLLFGFGLVTALLDGLDAVTRMETVFVVTVVIEVVSVLQVGVVEEPVDSDVDVA